MAQAPNVLHFKTPTGGVESIDLGQESPDSPQVKQLIGALLQQGFVPAEGPDPVREPTPAPAPGSFEQMQSVGPMALRDAAVGGIGSVASNTVFAPFEGGQVAAGPMGRELAEGIVPKDEQQLLKEGLLLLTGIPRTPTKIASKIALSIARTLAPAAVDVLTGNDVSMNRRSAMASVCD